MRSHTVVLPDAVPPHTPMRKGSRVPSLGCGDPGTPARHARRGMHTLGRQCRASKGTGGRVIRLLAPGRTQAQRVAGNAPLFRSNDSMRFATSPASFNELVRTGGLRGDAGDKGVGGAAVAILSPREALPR